MVRDRINHASSLYQMVGHMADVILLPKPGDSRGKARLFTDVPVAYAREHLIPPDRAAMIVTFEYGPKKPGDERPSSSMPGRDVFRQARTPFAPGNGAWVGVSEFLHPVFRFHFPVRDANVVHCFFQRSNWISRHMIVSKPNTFAAN